MKTRIELGITLLFLFSIKSSIAFVLKTGTGTAVSVGDLKDGDYWIQSALNSSVLIGAFENGVHIPGPGYVHPANVSAQTHDPNRNEDVEKMLRWYVEIRNQDPLEKSALTQIYTYGPNYYNRMDWYEMGTMFPINAEWLLVDYGNGNTAIRFIDVWGEIHDACMTNLGLGKYVEELPCDEHDTRQHWHFIPADK